MSDDSGVAAAGGAAAGGADAVDRDSTGQRTHAEFGVALALDLVGAAGAALMALPAWQVITSHAPRPRPDVVVHVTGRTVDAAPLAFGLVALAGVVAVLATRGVIRRGVGVIIALAGIGLVWRAISSVGAVSDGRARSLVSRSHQEVSTSSATPVSIVVRTAWPLLTVACGVLVVAAGLLIAWHGHRWRAMSARYESDPVRVEDPAKAAASMWTALDRGEDPTSR